jgi:hypothetical protein
MSESKKSFERASTERRQSLASEFLYFLKENKKWWLAPILIVLGLIALLAVLAGTGAAPWIYSGLS